MQMIIVLTNSSSQDQFAFALDHGCNKFSGLRARQVILIKQLVFCNHANPAVCRKSPTWEKASAGASHACGGALGRFGWRLLQLLRWFSSAPHGAHLRGQINRVALRQRCGCRAGRGRRPGQVIKVRKRWLR